MRNWYLWFCIVIFFGSAYSVSSEVKSEYILKTVFENPVLSFDIKNLQLIKKLLTEIENTTIEQQAIVAEIVKDDLNKQLEELSDKIETEKRESKPIPFTMWRAQNLLLEQRNHMSEIVNKLPKQNFIKRLFIWLGFYGQERQTINNLAQDILNFIKLEREKILFSYPKTITYLGLEKKLPELIRFWDEQQHRARLLQDVKQMTSQAEIQSFIVDLLLQTAVFMGASVYEGWVSKTDLDYYNSLAEQEKKMQEDFATFSKKLQEQQNINIKNIVDNFQQQSKSMSQQLGITQTLFSNEITFLNKLYDNSPPKNNYLYQGKVIDAIGLDQAFEVSKMYTPTSNYAWYNIYPQPNQILQTAVLSGASAVAITDWQYDSQTDQFYQYNLVPLRASKELQDIAQKSLPSTYFPDTGQYAHNNAIFTEYITGQTNYEIEIECTLIGATFPFFMGIIFNKARWISGVVERIEQYRLLGIYGVEDETGTKKASLVFAEYKYTPPENKTAQPQILTPFSQIINPNYQPLASLDNNLVTEVSKNALSFSIQISVQATAVTLSVATLDNSGNKNFIVENQTIKDLNPLLFLYHGIGFMAPGCQASFKIIKPVELTYDASQKIAFEKMINDELKK